MIQPEEYILTSHGAAREVEDSYDRYPYPRPIDDLDKYRQLWQDDRRRRADYHLFWPFRSYREDQSILVAGCGTSQAAKHAMRWPAAQVTGIDFSATSVRHTQELKRKYKLANLQIHQLPIERVTELATIFDQIVCTGVLHHLADPAVGLDALRRVLKPEGAMHLMVYAPHGRTGIYILQEFCRRTGIRPTDDDIHDLMVALKALPPGHPLEKLLRDAPDFRQEGALADALLHPRDRSYSVPQLIEFLEQGRLVFGRWVRQAPYLPHCGAIAKLPQAARMASLSRIEQYSAVELFRGTMVCHSVVAYRAGSAAARQQSTLAGDAWLDYVPIRMPDTICIQERVPPWAAAVLINRSHTFTDLFLPIDSFEKLLFDSIDGRRNIGQILQGRPCDSRLDNARDFFERLWHYDQVVFDTSSFSDELANGRKEWQPIK